MAKFLRCYDYFNDLWKDCEQVWLVSSEIDQTILSPKDCIIFLGERFNYETISAIKAKKKILIADSPSPRCRRTIVYKKFDKEKYSLAQAKNQLAERYPSNIWHISWESCWDIIHSPFEYHRAEIDNNLYDYLFSGPVIIGKHILLADSPLELPTYQCFFSTEQKMQNLKTLLKERE